MRSMLQGLQVYAVGCDPLVRPMAARPDFSVARQALPRTERARGRNQLRWGQPGLADRRPVQRNRVGLDRPAGRKSVRLTSA